MPFLASPLGGALDFRLVRAQVRSLGQLGNNLPLALKRLHQSGDLRQPKAGEPTVLQARDRRLIDPARALESTLGPPVSEASPPKLDPEQPKALHLPIGERPAFGAAQRFRGAD